MRWMIKSRRVKVKRVVNYAVLTFVLFVMYRLLWRADVQKDTDVYRYSPGNSPRNMPPLGSLERGDLLYGDTVAPVMVELQESGADLMDAESYQRQGRHRSDELSRGGDEAEDLQHGSLQDDTKLLLQNPPKERADFPNEDLHAKRRPEKPKMSSSKPKFLPDGVDWEVEREMTKRRAAFFLAVRAKEQSFNVSDFKDMHEKDDDFAFVTAGSHSTYSATVEFIFSIQYFYPESRIAVYDIGLTVEERDFLNTLCQTEVVSMWLQMWPDNLYEIRHKVWRPLLLQFAMAKFGHYVYVEPGRFVYKQGIKDYIEASRKHGVLFGGKQLKHSSFVVTNPHMHTFLQTNERKLQATPHFEFSLAVIHNTRRVKHEFMRHLVSCALEEYCISPPGSKVTCDLNMGNNKKYARCHRYDESAINLIMNRWHNYQPREYLMRDVITRHFDGRDMTDMVKVCNASLRDEV